MPMYDSLGAETIAALASGAPPAPIGVVRLSGPGVSRILKQVFRSPSGRLPRARQMCLGHIRDGDVAIDQAQVVLYRAPHSYTGEDAAEIFCHGGRAVLDRVLALLFRQGARPAQPGEFTRRAFLNQKMDLTAAEAVNDLVRASTWDTAQAAALTLSGRLRSTIEAIRERATQAAALVEAQLDFPEEVAEVDKAEIVSALEQASLKAQDLRRTARLGRLQRGGARLAIVGAPNVGKSSLLNALLGEERAIVHAQPGTTRDLTEHPYELNGIPVIAVDTAGLGAPEHPVEKEAMRRAREAAQAADVALLVLDASRPLEPHDLACIELTRDKPRALAINKADLPHHPGGPLAHHIRSELRWCALTSALHKTGLEELQAALASALLEDVGGKAQALTVNARQAYQLEQFLAAAEEARAAIREDRPLDQLAAHLRDALAALDTITGAVYSQEVIDRVFSSFCLGK